MIPDTIPYLVPSATLPQHILADVMKILRMNTDKTVFIRRSNDRPNVYITVRRIRHSLKSFRDLDFLIPKKPGDRMPKFLVFFDNIADSIAALKALRSRLPAELKDKIVWFNSDMTPRFREFATGEYKSGHIFGLYCTDSFGMVSVVHCLVFSAPDRSSRRVWTSQILKLSSSGESRVT